MGWPLEVRRIWCEKIGRGKIRTGSCTFNFGPFFFSVVASRVKHVLDSYLDFFFSLRNASFFFCTAFNCSSFYAHAHNLGGEMTFYF